jgi:hypothetical protein
MKLVLLIVGILCGDGNRLDRVRYLELELEQMSKVFMSYGLSRLVIERDVLFNYMFT